MARSEMTGDVEYQVFRRDAREWGTLMHRILTSRPHPRGAIMQSGIQHGIKGGERINKRIERLDPEFDQHIAAIFVGDKSAFPPLCIVETFIEEYGRPGYLRVAETREEVSHRHDISGLHKEV